MKVKRRAYEVVLSNGETVLIHEPRISEMGVFIRAMPALRALSDLMKSAKTDVETEGVIGIPVFVPDEAIEGIYPLFAVMSDITVDEFKDLGFWDGLAIINTLDKFLPNEQAPTVATE